MSAFFFFMLGYGIGMLCGVFITAWCMANFAPDRADRPGPG